MKILFFFGLVGGWIPPVVFAQVTQQHGQGDAISGLLTGSAVTILGTAVIAFVRGWVVAGIKYDKLEAKYDAAIDELRQRNKDDRESFIPTMIRMTDLVTDLLAHRGPAQ